MADRRRYTGTQTLQLGWTLVALLAVVALQVVAGGGPVPSAVAFLGPVVAWVVGLLALGIRERYHWNRLVSASSFERLSGPREADLERIVGGHSVQVVTRVPDLFGTHTVMSAPVEGVDADFTIRITHRSVADDDGGLATGQDALDERFVITGKPGNVKRLLSTELQETLLAIETPGTCTVTGERVEYDVPFTRLTAAELDAIGECVATVAARLEALAANG